MTSALSVSGEVDHSLMKEFFDDYNEAHELCEDVILQLETSPNDKTLVNRIFRAVHNVKGNLVYVNLKHLTPLLQSIEDVLDDIRNQLIPYNPSLGDVILLGLDTTQVLVMERVENMEHSIEETHFHNICEAIHVICKTSTPKIESAINRALELLKQAFPPPSPLTSEVSATSQESQPVRKIATNTISANKHLSAAPSKSPFKTTQQAGMLVTKISAEPANETFEPETPAAPQEHQDHPAADAANNKYGQELKADMDFFAALSRHIETRSCYWDGRTARILELALAMNSIKGERTDPAQLTAAVYMHDFGMAFLPLELLHKKDQLSLGDSIKIKRHPKMAYDFLRRMGQWDMAATIAIQHHERLDGNGYPRGLKGSEICDGAKILSIIDTFDARTHDRAHSESSKRALISSVFEINRHAGGQFSDYWIDAFQTALNQQKNR